MICYILGLCGELKENILYEIKVILNELIINAIVHGNGFDSSKSITVTVKIIETKYVVLIIEDEGEGYCYKSLNKSMKRNKSIALCDMKETGRGLWIVRNLCDNLHFNSKGNKAVALKKISDYQ